MERLLQEFYCTGDGREHGRKKSCRRVGHQAGSTLEVYRQGWRPKVGLISFLLKLHSTSLLLDTFTTSSTPNLSAHPLPEQWSPCVTWKNVGAVAGPTDATGRLLETLNLLMLPV